MLWRMPKRYGTRSRCVTRQPMARSLWTKFPSRCDDVRCICIMCLVFEKERKKKDVVLFLEEILFFLFSDTHSFLFCMFRAGLEGAWTTRPFEWDNHSLSLQHFQVYLSKLTLTFSHCGTRFVRLGARRSRVFQAFLVQFHRVRFN